MCRCTILVCLFFLSVIFSPSLTPFDLQIINHLIASLSLFLSISPPPPPPPASTPSPRSHLTTRSGALQLGDRILSINGTATQTLTHNEVNALLENAGNVINLEIAFESLPGADVDDSTTKKIAAIKLQRETPTSYGFTISGGRDDDNRRITVSNVTVGSYAYR